MLLKTCVINSPLHNKKLKFTWLHTDICALPQSLSLFSPYGVFFLGGGGLFLLLFSCLLSRRENSDVRRNCTQVLQLACLGLGLFEALLKRSLFSYFCGDFSK